MTRPTIGQTVFAPTGKGLKKLKVSTVNQYSFSVAGSDAKYGVKTWALVGAVGSRLYKSQQQWDDTIEAQEIEDYLRAKLGRWGRSELSLVKLRQMKGVSEYEG